jgi:hypothetical protein
VQSNERVRVVEDPDDPGMHGPDVDAEFFVQLTLECVRNGLAGLELSSRELPVSRVRLSLGTAREEQTAVGPDQDADRDVDRRAGDGHPPAERAEVSRCPAH